MQPPLHTDKNRDRPGPPRTCPNMPRTRRTHPAYISPSNLHFLCIFLRLSQVSSLTNELSPLSNIHVPNSLYCTNSLSYLRCTDLTFWQTNSHSSLTQPTSLFVPRKFFQTSFDNLAFSYGNQRKRPLYHCPTRKILNRHKQTTPAKKHRKGQSSSSSARSAQETLLFTSAGPRAAGTRDSKQLGGHDSVGQDGPSVLPSVSPEPRDKADWHRGVFLEGLGSVESRAVWRLTLDVNPSKPSGTRVLTHSPVGNCWNCYENCLFKTRLRSLALEIKDL